ncbi:hypothetical protein [Methylotenera sp. L2L1]|uniref:hypothetical protein n=1 Tax=Methylotenera sp. L2L1 TaxID=1502770 RepID=UPI00055DCC8B|nr:hypothetical protein [Methylotenera sp. L2L1]
MSHKDHSLASTVENDRKYAKRNEIILCSVCGVELARKKLKKHKRNAHTPPPNQNSLENTLKTANSNPLIRKIKNELRSDIKQLKSIPLEYQASVYAKMEREKRAQQDIKRLEQLQTLKSTSKKLKEELRKAVTASVRVVLERKISACDKAIKKAPKPRCKWSPILPGSFESGK